jgi:WD40 repeat protein
VFKLAFCNDAHASPVYSVDGNSKYLYTGGADHLIRRWFHPSGRQDAFNISHSHTPMALRCIGDSMLAIAYLNGENYLIDAFSKKVLFEFRLIEDHVVSFYVDLMSNRLLLGTASGHIKALALDSMKWLYEDQVAQGKIRKIHASENESMLYFTSQDGHVGQFDSEKGVLKDRFSAHQGGANGLVINAGFILTGGKDGYLRLWDEKSKTLCKEIPAHRGVIYDLLAFEDCWVSASRDKSIKIWERYSLAPLQKLSIHRQSVNALLQQNEHSFVSVSDDKKMAYWTKL